MLQTTASIWVACLSLAPNSQVNFESTWNTVESAISGRYYARATRKVEMEKRLREFGPKAKAAKSRAEFSSIVNAMIDQFGDSHFDFFSTEDQGYYAMGALLPGRTPKKMPHIGAWFMPGSGGYTVQMAMEGGPAHKAGLRKGDLITLIDGKPFTPVASLQPSVGKSVNLTYSRNGVTKSVQATVANDAAFDMFLNGSRDSARIIDFKGKKVGYFHLWTMANDSFRNALNGAVLGELHETDAFILDIRDGFGGRPEGFVDPFFRPEVDLNWKFSEFNTLKQKLGYGKPMVLLINGGSRSAKEVVSYIFKKSKRATLMGQRTAGHVLGTSPMAVEDWAYLEIPMVELTTDGKTLEGNGVSPDIEIKAEFDANGNDLFIQSALEYLVQKPML